MSRPLSFACVPFENIIGHSLTIKRHKNMCNWAFSLSLGSHVRFSILTPITDVGFKSPI